MDESALQPELALQARLAVGRDPNMEVARFDAVRAIGAGEGQGFFGQGEGHATGFAGLEHYALVAFQVGRRQK
jgi:hypothetical protein